MLDYNKIQSYGPVKEVLNLEPLKDKWTSFGFDVSEVNGHDIKDLKKIVESSIEYAESDINYRMLIEWKIKAKKIINEINYYEKDIERLCDKKNIENIKKIINMLKLELNNNNKEKIEQLIKN